MFDNTSHAIDTGKVPEGGGKEIYICKAGDQICSDDLTKATDNIVLVHDAAAQKDGRWVEHINQGE